MSMHPFRLHPTAVGGRATVVLSTCAQSPLEAQDELQAELQLQGIPAGKILLDLLITQASRTRRFFEVDFDGRILDIGSCREVLIGITSLAEQVAPLYLDRLQDFDTGRLPHELRYLLVRGIPVPLDG